MYMISAIPFLDQRNRCYTKILTINEKPPGPLGNHIVRINPPRLSPFVNPSPCSPLPGCILAFKNGGRCSELMGVDDIPLLFTLITQGGYQIDTSITRMMNKSKVQVGHDLVCFITA